MSSPTTSRAPSLLKQARQSLSLTQPAFAHRMHVTKRTIVRWESGLSLATPYILASAAHLVRSRDPALASEMKEHALELFTALGGDPNVIENVKPPAPTPEAIASMRVVESLALALRMKPEALQPLLVASLRHAVSQGLTAFELSELLS